MKPELRELGLTTRGFMPEDEGMALYEAALSSNHDSKNNSPLLEIGSYCGKSSIYIGAAAAELNKTLFCIDHHRGSEENQAGWEYHEPDLVDKETGQLDTLPHFRKTIAKANLENTIVAIVGDSIQVANNWNTFLSFLFIDGGHGTKPAHNDYDAWTPYIEVEGTLCIHDVFENPKDGGRPPYEIYCRALESKMFQEISATGSLRVLKRIAR